MASKESQLVIRARDEASKALEAVTKAVSSFQTAQDKLGATGGAASANLTKLASSVADLGKAATALSGVEKIATQLGKVEASVGTLSTRLEAAKGELASYNEKLAAASEVSSGVAKSAQEADSAFAKQQKSVADLGKEYRTLQAAVNNAEKALAAAQARATKTPKDATLLAKQADKEGQAAAARAAANAAKAKVDAERQALETLKAARENARKEALDAAKAEAGFAASVRATQMNIANLSATLESSKAALTDIQAKFVEGAKAAGLEAASTEALAAAQARLKTTTEAATAALAAQSARTPSAGPAAAPTTAAGATAQYRAQVSAVDETKAAYDAARASLAAFQTAMKGIENPTVVETAALETQKAVVIQASQAWERAKAALAATRGGITPGASSANAAAIREAAAAAQAKAAADRVAAAAAEASAAAEAHETQALTVLQRIKAGYVATVNAYANAAKAANAETKAAGAHSSELVGHIRNLAGAYLTVFSAINSFKSVLGAASDAEAAQVRIGTALGQGQEAGAVAYQHAAGAARALRLDILTTVNAYGEFIASTKETSIEGDKTRRIFDDMLVTMRAFKLAPDAMERVIIALKDMAARGTIAKKEINQLDLAMPVGTLQALAKAAGYSNDQLGEFNKAVHAGKIGLDVILPAFDAIRERAEKGLPAALLTTQSAMANLKNAFFDFKVAIGEGEFMEGATKGMNAFAEALNSPEVRKAFHDIASGVGTILEGLAKLLPYTKEIVAAFAGLAAVKLVNMVVGIGNIATAVGRLIGVVKNLEVSFVAVGAALSAEGAALAGPVGIAVLVAAVGAGLALWATNTQTAEDAAQSYQNTMTRVKNALVTAGGDVSQVGSSPGDISVKDVDAEVLRQRAAYAKAKGDLVSYTQAQIAANAAVDDLGNTIENKQVTALNQLALAYGAGKLSGSQFREQVAALADSFKDADTRKIADGYIELSKGVKTTGEQLGNTAEVAKGMGSNLEGLDKDAKLATTSMKDLTDAAKGSNAALGIEGAKALQNYEDALKKIEALIPGMKEKLKELKEEADISDNFKRGMDALNEAYKSGAVNAEDYRSGRRILQGATDDAKTATDGSTVAIASAIVEHLMQKYGVGREAAIGAAGVMGYESGNFKQLQERNPVNGGRGGYGYTQSTGPRRDNEDAFFKAHPDLDPSSLEGQMAWFDAEASGPYAGAISKLKNENTVAGGAKSFLENFEGLKDTGAAVNPDGGVPATAAHIARAEQYSRILPDSPKKDAAEQMADLKKREEDAAADAENDAKRKAAIDKEISDEQKSAEIAKQKLSIEQEMTKFKESHPNATKEDIANEQKALDVKLRELEVQKAGADFADKNKLAKNDPQVAQYEAAVRARLEASQAEKADTTSATAGKHNMIELEKEINALLAERKNLLKELQRDEESGDTSKVEQTKEKIEQTTEKAKELISKAREMWGAVGGSDAQAGLARLDALSGSLTNATGKFQILGFSAEQSKKIATDFANDLTSAVQDFAKEISEGIKPIQAFRDAFLKMASDFLQQIAKMIIQQAIFKALGMGANGDLTGGGLFGLIGGGGSSGGAGGAAGAGSALSAVTSVLGGGASGGGGAGTAISAITKAVGAGSGTSLSAATPSQLSPEVLSFLSSKANKGIDVAHLNPEFGNKIADMLKKADAQGIPTKITSGARSFDTQNQLYQNMLARKEGKPIPYPEQAVPAVAAKPGSSPHEFGNAADIYANNPAQQSQLDALARAEGLKPGSDFGDVGHFQIAGNVRTGPFANGFGNNTGVDQVAQQVQQEAQQMKQTVTSAVQSTTQSVGTLTQGITGLGTKAAGTLPDMSTLTNSLDDVAQSATKAVGSAGGGGGLGGLISSLFGFIPKHGGGVIGSGSSAGRQASPLAFLGASRYHTGGVVGLGQDEVPIIAKRNEEVLTSSDPRHRDNGGGALAQAMSPSVKVINAFDASSFLSHGLSTTEGEKAMMNFVRANPGAIKSALGA